MLQGRLEFARSLWFTSQASTADSLVSLALQGHDRARSRVFFVSWSYRGRLDTANERLRIQFGFQRVGDAACAHVQH